MQTQTIWFGDAAGVPLSFSAMRSAVDAWLFARSRGQHWAVHPGAESSPEKIARLRRELHWLGVDADEILLSNRQSLDGYCAAAAHLITGGRAYCGDVHKRRRVFFCLPETAVLRNVIVDAGPKELPLQPNMTAEISRQGISLCGKNGKLCRCAFSAMPDLVLRGAPDRQQSELFSHQDWRRRDLFDFFNAGAPIRQRECGRELFNAAEETRQLEFGKKFCITGAVQAEFFGREIVFSDEFGEPHRYPMEQLEDPVIIDEFGRPSPLLIRVLTTIEKEATLLVCDGLDGREASLLTLLFDAFGYPPPRFHLLPENFDGAPDYAAFRRMGVSRRAVFQELARMGCGSLPEEKLLSSEMWVRRFRRRNIDSVYCRFEPEKLRELNRRVLSALPPEEFVRRAAPYALRSIARDPRFAELAKSKQPETKVLSEAAQWRF